MDKQRRPFDFGKANPTWGGFSHEIDFRLGAPISKSAKLKIRDIEDRKVFHAGLSS
jgi:hypothetical protein